MNNYINLIDKLTPLDKERITNYIKDYGINLKYFEGLDKWLQNWSHSNQKLYKLLGNSFIYKFKFTYERPKEEINKEIHNLCRSHPFNEEYALFLDNYIKNNVDKHNMIGFLDADNYLNIQQNKIIHSIKYKRADQKKTLQIQSGAKPIKAIQKIIEYFKDIYTFKYFEDFKKQHSLIFNNKKLTGDLCISIHPLDFMTMSDNASNWSSCMSWTDSGCYHVGTIEMMNSNNVLCCYLEAKDPYYFAKDKRKEENVTWNNKKWRNLVYITKDIIMGGKSYPYANDDITKQLILTVKELANKNLNWDYKFGPELYQDMKYVFSEYPIERSRNFIRYKNTKKHNILWNTQGMYNDMLNDHHTKYWCYRNKVKQNKVISVSGKAPCLCCGDSIIRENYDYEYDYNERYLEVGEAICSNCQDNFYCDNCKAQNPIENYFTILTETGRELRLCKDCINKYIKYCPDCHKPIFIDPWREYFFAYKEPKGEEKRFIGRGSFFIIDDSSDSETYLPLCACKDCASKYFKRLKNKKITRCFQKYSISILDEDRLLYKNLESCSLEKVLNTVVKNAATASDVKLTQSSAPT